MRALIFVWLAESSSQVDHLFAHASQSDFFILTQSWFPEACKNTDSTSDMCTRPTPLQKHRFILGDMCKHGPGSVEYEFCGGAPLHVENFSSATRSLLSQFWPEALGGTSWSGAWWYCGTCTGLSQSDYFATALSMHQTTETLQLKYFLSVSVGRHVETNQVLEAYGGPRSAVLVCRDRKTLAGIYTCWSTNSTGLLSIRKHCPLALRSIQNCESKIFIPDFPENSKQSEFATAVWLMQYTVLCTVFLLSWRADRLGSNTCFGFTKRNAMQLLAMTHAVVGVISELWAIYWRTGGEVGLTVWPWMSVLELVTNLGITLLMLTWYTLVCAGLGRAKRLNAYLGASIWFAVLLIWAGLYLYYNIQATDPTYVKQMELDPIPLISKTYYFINLGLESLCFRVVFKMHDILYADRHVRPSIRRIFFINLISLLASVVMVLVHVDLIKEFLSEKIVGWHSWTMGSLFFIRYVTVAFLIEPITTCDENDTARITNALQFGPPPTYEFKHGRAFVACISDYSQSERLQSIENKISGHLYAAALIGIGFKTIDKYDLNSTDLLRYFEEMVQLAKDEDADGIAFAFVGHGDTDVIYASDGRELAIAELKSKCLSGEALKPKLFFFDCCRGDSTETRRSRRSRLDFSVALTCRSGPSANADCLECYATARHFPAYCGEFTERLCKHIQALAEHAEYDIEDALKKAGAEVAPLSVGRCRRQAPTYESSLTRRFVLRKAFNSTSPTRPTRTDSGISLPTVASTAPAATLTTPPSRVSVFGDASEPLV